MTIRSFALIAAFTVSLAACGQGHPTPGHDGTAATIDQTNLCEVKRWEHDIVKESCTPGQKVVYLPERFGNAQLPIFFAAVNCDLRYTVALTEGAVTCIYLPITPAPDDQANDQGPSPE